MGYFTTKERNCKTLSPKTWPLIQFNSHCLKQKTMAPSSLMTLLRSGYVCLQEMTSMFALKAPFHKNKPKTFAFLNAVVQDIKGEQRLMKMDRNILQRLITAYRAGLEVNLDIILQHELMSVPLSLATNSGILHSTNKSVLDQECTHPTYYCISRTMLPAD